MATTKKTETTDATTETATFGVQGLLDEIEAATGKVYQPATIRILLRKLAADGTVEKTGGRWTFEGPEDPAVEAVIEAVKAGKAEKEPAADADKPKKAPAKKKAAAKKTAPKEEPVEEDEDDLEVDLEDI